MNLTNISGIRTTDDLQAQAAGQTSELDRNAFLKLFTTQLQIRSAGSVKNERLSPSLRSFYSEATTLCRIHCRNSSLISVATAYAWCRSYRQERVYGKRRV